MITLSLTSGWTLEIARAAQGAPAELEGRRLPATVPGCVHTDLLAADVIPDPLAGLNESAVQWVGESDWSYRCRFSAPPELLDEERLELVCEGLDTVASLTLDGRAIGEAANMHRPHRFDVGGVLRAGENELVVTFRSALAYAREQAARLGDRPRQYPLPFNFVRKMACNFGWDWGPTLVTAGVWKPVRIEAWSGARIREARPLVRVALPAGRQGGGAAGSLELRVTLDRAAPGSAPARLEAEVHGPDGGAALARAATRLGASQEGATLRLEVPRVEPWWPRGYGSQPLYRVTLSLRGPAGQELDARSFRTGFREVILDTRADRAGAAFTFVVNGRPVFAKGADWIPDDPFPSRLTPDRVRVRLDQAAAAGMNMLRVWGGGVYESEAFYDACDELGLLVWQDFAFACAAYPEEEPFASEVEAEARANIARLAPHPSLALWNGNNENLWGYEDWGWKDALAGRTWGRTYYLDLLPRLMAELDPTRPYWPGSPWSGRPSVHPNADGYGCKHIWDAWNEKDYVAYRSYRPRFVAEFGHQAPPAYATLRRALPDDPLSIDSPGMRHHQKAAGGNAKLLTRLGEHFPVPASFDVWHFAAQLNQARALELGIRHFRSLAPHCMGTLVWQLNDTWPAISWSAVDSDGRLKLAWFALRRAYAARLLLLEPAGDGVALLAHNDRDDPWEAEVRVRRLRFDGDLLGEEAFALRAEGRSVSTPALLPARLATPGDAAEELLVATAGPVRAWHFFDRDKNLRYPAPLFTAALERQGGVHRLRIRARSLLRDLTLSPDRLHPGATVDDGLVTLLPGESHLFTVRSPVALTRSALASPPALLCANDVARL